jgi:hypothetical protein
LQRYKIFVLEYKAQVELKAKRRCQSSRKLYKKGIKTTLVELKDRMVLYNEKPTKIKVEHNNGWTIKINYSPQVTSKRRDYCQ